MTDTPEQFAQVQAKRCAALSDAARQALDWVADARNNSVSIEQQELGLKEQFRRTENAAYKLGRTVVRRMCVGVYGPSQAGKSYLVNSLGKQEGGAFMVDFAGRNVDFLNKINPQNEGESTGLVARFSTALPEGHPEAPLTLRLLSEMDVVKILMNSFQFDFNRDRTPYRLPDASKIAAKIKDLRGCTEAVMAGRPGTRETFDLQEYVFDTCQRQYEAFTQSIFWAPVADLAPKLSVTDRASLFSLLWGDLEPFTELYVRLVNNLEMLGFPEEIACGVEAVMDIEPEETRRLDSILNVNTLFQLGKEDGAKHKLTVKVVEDGAIKISADLPRSEVAALTAEMQIGLGTGTWPFFQHADLLDFPGARSRINAVEFEDAVRDVKDPEDAANNAVAQFLLRGKVAYLFHRYVAERELTAMLLCIADSNLEVPELGPDVNTWVENVLGKTTDGRARNPNTLFVMLTKFDREFNKAAGQDESSRKARWDGRLREALLKLWTRYGWPDDWDGKPFRNCFWLRNPAFENPAVMRYECGVEQEVAAENREYVDTMRGYCLDGELVNRHFADPPKAFDEAMKVMDGGVSYLVEALAGVCSPTLKLEQITARIDEQVHSFTENLSPFHDSDSEEKRAEKRKQAQAVVYGLKETIGGQRFGSLMSALQLSADVIWPIYLGMELGEGDEDEESGKGSGAAPSSPGVAVGGAVDLDTVFGDLPGSDGSEQEQEQLIAPVKDRSANFADEVVGLWGAKLRRMPGDQLILNQYKISEETFRGMAQELTKAAERLGLSDRIAEAVRQETKYANAQWDRLAARNVHLAFNIIAGHIDWLGMDLLPLDDRAGVPMDNPQRRVFDDPPKVEGDLVLPEKSNEATVFYQDWVHAYLRLAEDNAGFSGGGELTKGQNARLGEIISMTIKC